MLRVCFRLRFDATDKTVDAWRNLLIALNDPSNPRRDAIVDTAIAQLKSRAGLCGGARVLGRCSPRIGPRTHRYVHFSCGDRDDDFDPLSLRLRPTASDDGRSQWNVPDLMAFKDAMHAALDSILAPRKPPARSVLYSDLYVSESD